MDWRWRGGEGELNDVVEYHTKVGAARGKGGEGGGAGGTFPYPTPGWFPKISYPDIFSHEEREDLNTKLKFLTDGHNFTSATVTIGVLRA